MGELVCWRYADEPIIGIILVDLGIKTFTRKYLIFWCRDDMLMECFEADIENT